jgi:hypothetical protein
LPIGVHLLSIAEGRGQQLLSAAPALFPFNFLLFLLFPLHPNINGRNNEGPFFSGQVQKSGWCQMQFVKAIVSDICFTITFFN